MSRETGFPREVRGLIESRAGVEGEGPHSRWVRCEGCGVWCKTGGYDLHHRIPRGAGGTKRPHVNQAANGLCFGRHCCHAYAENHRSEAMELGWLISQHRNILPSEVPAHLHDGCYLLSDGGDRFAVPCRHKEAA